MVLVTKERLYHMNTKGHSSARHFITYAIAFKSVVQLIRILLVKID
jgi:hypothetical protein